MSAMACVCVCKAARVVVLVVMPPLLPLLGFADFVWRSYFTTKHLSACKAVTHSHNQTSSCHTQPPPCNWVGAHALPLRPAVYYCLEKDSGVVLHTHTRHVCSSVQVTLQTQHAGNLIILKQFCLFGIPKSFACCACQTPAQ